MARRSKIQNEERSTMSYLLKMLQRREYANLDVPLMMEMNLETLESEDCLLELWPSCRSVELKSQDLSCRCQFP